MYAVHSKPLCYYRGSPPPPPSPNPPFSPRFQSCGLGFVYPDRGQFEHDRILKVFQHSPTSLFVSWQFLSSLPRFRLLTLCPPADFWFALGKTSVLTHGPCTKLDCWDLVLTLPVKYFETTTFPCLKVPYYVKFTHLRKSTNMSLCLVTVPPRLLLAPQKWGNSGNQPLSDVTKGTKTFLMHLPG